MGLEGRYTVIKKVADGGMAEIFLATQTGAQGFARNVVVKRILPVFSMDPQFRNMIVDEAHIAMSLHHSNIVQVLDLGQEEGRYFLVLDLVDGWDLATVLARGAAADFPLPAGLALHIIAEICRGLAYAHGQTRDGKPLGIVHRDISPQNVLVSEQGEVKLTDFGIAKALGKRERTQTGVIKGKLDFMSPEQARGAATDTRSDIFSAGTVLYLMSTGRRPFEGADLKTLLRIQNAQFPPPEEVHPALAPKLAAVIGRAMRKEPAERYPSAEAMMRDVEEVLRTDFASVGQSELKRYLEELGRRDGVPPISRAPGLPPKEASAGSAGSGGGAKARNPTPVPTLALADTKLDHGAELVGATAATAPDLQVPRPTPSSEDATRAEYVRGGRRPVVARRPSRTGRNVLLAVLLGGGAAAGGIYVLESGGPRKLLDGGRKRLERAGAPLRGGDDDRAPAGASGGGAGTTRGRGEAAAGTAAGARAAPAKGRRPDPSPSARREPGSTRPAERPDPPSPGERPRSGGGGSGAESGSAGGAALVTVRLASRPSRAVVRNSSGGTLGTTPLALSLKPGSVQRLTFSKPGYELASRNFSVGGASNQTFTVELSRARRR